MKHISLFKTIMYSGTLVNIINCYSCCNTKPEDGKKYIQKALGIKETDFIEVKEFTDEDEAYNYLINNNPSNSSYKVGLEIHNFDRDLTKEEIEDSDNWKNLTKKSTFFCEFIKENVQLKVNMDLLEEYEETKELATKFSKTINNNKKITCITVFSKDSNEKGYFCK